MAVYPISCVEAKVSMDTDNDLITITRNERSQSSLPLVTEIKLSEVTAIEYKFLTYGVPNLGTGFIRFIYPGCPTGGDLMFGSSTQENIIQFKAHHKDQGDAFLAALKPIIEANKARMA